MHQNELVSSIISSLQPSALLSNETVLNRVENCLLLRQDVLDCFKDYEFGIFEGDGGFVSSVSLLNF